MPRALPDLKRRTVTVDTGRRAIDLAVDAAGHIRRTVTVAPEALTRADEADGPIGFRGHAAVFNTPTWIGSKRWGFWEEIAPGAFTKAIQENDVRFLINHDPNLVLARTTNGTLRLSQDGIGLATDADMNPTMYARDLALLLERGDVNQMSFAFNMIDYAWRQNDDGSETLVHQSVELFDVAVVTYPAYEATDAGLRTDMLAACRSAGFDDVELGLLAERLASPDSDLIVALRHLARGGTIDLAAQAETTPPAAPAAPDGARTGEASPAGDDHGTPNINPLSLRTLQQRTEMQRSI